MRLIDLVNGPWAIAPPMLDGILAIYGPHLRGDKIARQTFAMHDAPVAQNGQALSHLLRGS